MECSFSSASLLWATLFNFVKGNETSYEFVTADLLTCHLREAEANLLHLSNPLHFDYPMHRQMKGSFSSASLLWATLFNFVK